MADQSIQAGADTHGFDLSALFRRIDIKRREQEMSWAALAREVGVAASTIRRFSAADDAEADGVLALIRWLEAAPEEFFWADCASRAHLLPDRTGVVRVDMGLIDAAQKRPTANKRTRTTIQHLAEVAEQSSTPVAALVRISET